MSKLNKYGIIKRCIIVAIIISVISLYTLLGLYSGEVLLEFAAVVMWFCIISYSLIFLIAWLSAKEKQLEK